MNAYGRLCTEFYDLDKPHAPVAAYEFYLRAARAAEGPVLEPMCGSGRFLVPLLRAGVDIDGFDGSATMLTACRRRAAQHGLVPNVELGMLGEYQPRRSYALTFVPSGSFCLLTDPEEALAALRSLRTALAPRGRLLLEVERYLPGEAWTNASGAWTGRWVQRPDGARIVISGIERLDESRRISFAMNRYELVKDGRLLETEYEELDLRFYAEDELVALLDAAGFTNAGPVTHYSSHAAVREESFLVEAFRG